MAARARKPFEESREAIQRRTDRLFAKLMIIQWLAGVAAALMISPGTWIDTTGQTHLHVLTAILFAGAVTILPVFLAWKHPGIPLTRRTICVAQMLVSAPLIHLTGGRIETQFYILGSILFLVFFRGWVKRGARSNRHHDSSYRTRRGSAGTLCWGAGITGGISSHRGRRMGRGKFSR